MRRALANEACTTLAELLTALDEPLPPACTDAPFDCDLTSQVT